jgi:zinc protease
VTRTVELEIGERVGANGLRLLAVRNPGVATFACSVVLDVSVKDEAPGDEGLANMVGSCLDEGTTRRSALSLAEAVERIGGSLETTTSGGLLECPAEECNKAMRLLREVVTSPSFPLREVRRVRCEVLTGIESDKDDPRTVAGRRYRKEIYKRHPFARPQYGFARTVNSFKPSDLRRFHGKWFTPQGGFATAAGPGAVETTLDQLERVFGSVTGETVEHGDPPAVAMPADRVDIHLPMKREQVHVYLGHVGIRRSDPDFYALSVMDHILGSGPGFTSRISRRLRDEMGLCYSVHAGITFSAGLEPGCFTAYIGTSADHRQEAVDGFLEEIVRIRSELPTEEELRDVQDYLTGSFAFALERNSNLLSYAVRARRFDLGFDYIDKYPDLIRSITREDVRRVAEKHLDPDRFFVVSAGAG